jgi:hypothetical protein
MNIRLFSQSSHVEEIENQLSTKIKDMSHVLYELCDKLNKPQLSTIQISPSSPSLIAHAEHNVPVHSLTPYQHTYDHHTENSRQPHFQD